MAACLEGLVHAAAHADRHEPLKDYSKGLLLPGGRKSIELMAGRLSPDGVQAARQSLRHLVAKASWDDAAVLREVRRRMRPAIEQRGPIVAWIVADTGIPKKGRHSVDVARQYCGQLGRQDNCQVAVSLSLSLREASLPIGWRLQLPEEWAQDRERRRRAGVPEEIEFETKPEMAPGLIRRAVEEDVPTGVVLVDAADGSDTKFREGLAGLGLAYVEGVPSSLSVWRPGEALLLLKPRQRGRPPKRLRRSVGPKPVSVREAGEKMFRTVRWREGGRGWLASRFWGVRVRPAHRDFGRSEPHAEHGLLAEWLRGAEEATKYWLANLPAETLLKKLVELAKHYWAVERDDQELKQELGLGPCGGRGSSGFPHHATLCLAAYRFLAAERSRIPPSARAGRLEFNVPPQPEGYEPRGGTGRRPPD